MKIFLNKKIGVLGLSRTGLSSVKFLKKKDLIYMVGMTIIKNS